MSQTHHGPWHLAVVPTIGLAIRKTAWRRYRYGNQGQIIAVQWQF
jgi:hypothetical protein